MTVAELTLTRSRYIFIMFYSFGHSYVGDKLKIRFWFFVYPLPICIVGCLVFMFSDGFGPRYFSLFLLNLAFASFGTVRYPLIKSWASKLIILVPQIYSWNSNTIPRPPAKRTVALAFMNSVGNMV